MYVKKKCIMVVFNFWYPPETKSSPLQLANTYIVPQLLNFRKYINVTQCLYNLKLIIFR